jgi:VWFA-related protein
MMRIGIESAIPLRQRVIRFTSIVIVCLGVSKALTAQDQTLPETAGKIRVEVRQVLVPVIVTDRKGHYVTGLKALDFEILEDGVPQKVVAFRTEEGGASSFFESSATAVNPGGAAETSPAGANALPRRTYIVCLDTLNSAFENFSEVRDALRKFFKQEHGAASQYGLVVLGHQPAVIQDLTPDPAAMLAAIGRKDFNKSIQQSESRNLSQQEHELSSMLGDYCRNCPCAGAASAAGRTSTGSDRICSGKWGKIEMWTGSAAQERAALTRSFLSGLQAVVEQLSTLPGKRTLILVSDGFNLRPGRDLFGLLAAFGGDPGELLHNPVDTLEPEIQAIIRPAAAHDVTFYTLDSRGLYTLPAGGYDASAEVEMTRITVLLPEIQQEKETIAIENQAALGELAAATGGIFFHSSNDLLKGLKQSFADGREYYLLAYVPTNRATDGKFREIKVQVRGKNFLTRAKRGYWTPTN